MHGVLRVFGRPFACRSLVPCGVAVFYTRCVLLLRALLVMALSYSLPSQDEATLCARLLDSHNH